MEEFYTVLEVQDSGTPAVLVTCFDNINLAYQKYYTILAAASVSELPYHAGHIIRGSDGEMIEYKVFKRESEEMGDQ